MSPAHALPSTSMPVHSICVQLAGTGASETAPELLENMMQRALFPAEVHPEKKVFLFEVNSEVIFEGFCFSGELGPLDRFQMPFF